jgi:hypothetical protein
METTMVVEIPVCPPNFDRAVAHAAGGPIQLRAGIVGLGKQALADHVPGLLTCRGAVLAAVCDIDPGVVENSSKRLSVPGYTRPAALLDEEELDLVIVCVPHHAGGAVIEAAAMRGVHVLKEKPFATSMAEARRLAEVCEGSGIHLMVTLQRRLTRFMPVSSSLPTRSGYRSSSMPDTPCTSRIPRAAGAGTTSGPAAAASSIWATT